MFGSPRHLFFLLGFLSVVSLVLHPLVHSELESHDHEKAQVECQLCQNIDALTSHRAEFDLHSKWENLFNESLPAFSTDSSSILSEARAPPL